MSRKPVNEQIYATVGLDKIYMAQEPANIITKIPVATYALKYDNIMKEFYLQVIPDFVIPKKIYGGFTEMRMKRIVTSYFQKSKQLGVLLSGIKGSGKTMLTTLLSHELKKHNMPTIVVNQPFGGDDFNIFIQKLGESLIIFDEFEKTYVTTSEQEKLLTLLDGVYSSKQLFILTSNTSRLNEFFMNRPGRIYYHWKYVGLDALVIKEYAEDNLKPELLKHVESLCNLVYNVNDINFDMLKAIVEEMNRFTETPKEVLMHLNITQESSYKVYSVECKINGVDSDLTQFKVPKRSGMTSPVAGVNLDIQKLITYINVDGKDEKDWEEIEVIFEPSDIVSLNKGVCTLKQAHHEIGEIEIRVEEIKTGPPVWII